MHKHEVNSAKEGAIQHGKSMHRSKRRCDVAKRQGAFPKLRLRIVGL